MPKLRRWPMFNQVLHRQELMDEMIERLGVDVLIAVRAVHALGVVIAFTKASADSGWIHLQSCHCLRISVLTPISSARVGCPEPTVCGESTVIRVDDLLAANCFVARCAA